MQTRSSLAVLFLVLLIAGPAWSQGYNSAFGSGQYYGAAACPYGIKTPAAVNDIDDEIDGYQKEKDENNEEISKLRTKTRRTETVLEGCIGKSDMLTAIKEQLKSGGLCKDSATSKDDWKKICPNNGTIDKSVCDKVPSRTGDAEKCKEALAYKSDDSQYDYGRDLKRLAYLQGRNKDLDKWIASAGKDREDAMDDYQDKVRKGKTEAGCKECEEYAKKRRGPGVGMTVLAAGLDAGNILANYFTQRSAIKTAANLGYATYPYASSGYGYPMFTASLYGAAYGGVSTGGLGCAPTIGGAGNPMGPYGMAGPFGMFNPYGAMGGQFGYPQSIYGGLGGNMLTPGMTPWGMNCSTTGCGGPIGGMLGIGGNIAMGMGMQMGGMPGMGMGMPMGGVPGMMGMPGMGMQMGGMPGMGMQMGGMPGMMGMQMGGMPGMGMGMPMGGMPGMMGMQMGGMPGMGMGMPMGGVPGMMGMPGMGMQMGGFPGMMGMPGMQMGGFPGMMGMQMGGMPGMQMGGMPGMMGMQMGGGLGTGYYQQMMQQQMQMYQMQMDYQRQQQSQYQAKYQVVMGLYTELQSLQMRLTQAYSSLFGGGDDFGGGAGMTFGVGGVFGGAIGVTPVTNTITTPGTIPPPPSSTGR